MEIVAGMTEDQAAATAVPIGTLEELQKFGKDPKTYGSCSIPGDPIGSTGCRWFSGCRFRELRDRLNGRQGPDMVGVEIALASGAADGRYLPCFNYYRSGLHAKFIDSPKNGDIIRTGHLFAGDSIKLRKRVRKHAKPEPGCDACAKNTCYAMTESVVTVTIPAMARLGQVAGSGSLAAEIRAGAKADGNVGERETMQQAVETQTQRSGSGRRSGS